MRLEIKLHDEHMYAVIYHNKGSQIRLAHNLDRSQAIDLKRSIHQMVSDLNRSIQKFADVNTVLQVEKEVSNI